MTGSHVVPAAGLDTKSGTPSGATDYPAVGIDVGGTKIACALVSNCKLVTQRKEVPTRPGREPNIESILHFVDEFRKLSPVAGVGIATCGMVSRDGVIVGSAENISGWQDTPLKTLIEERTNLTVEVENDANASAYGEYRAYNLGNKSSVAVITIGTGIGGGLIVDGKVLKGAHFAAGEVGHFKMSRGRHRRCSCGLWDCFEAYGAGRGLVITAEELLQGIHDDQSKLGKFRRDLTTRIIIEAASNGDGVAKDAMHKWHEHLSQGICTVAQVMDPECFILTGGLSKFVDYPLLNQLTNDRAVVGLAGKIQIHPSLLSENPGLIGAAQLLLDKVAVNKAVG